MTTTAARLGLRAATRARLAATTLADQIVLTAADRERLRDLLVAAADGDRSALDPLFATLLPATREYCQRVFKGDSLAEDAAQETMVALFRRMSEFDASRDPLAWVLGIATWQCRTLARRRWRRSEAPIDASPVPISDGVEAMVLRDLVAAALASVATLSSTDIDTITASILSEQEHSGTSGATFRKRLERARQRLRLAWRSRHGTS